MRESPIRCLSLAAVLLATACQTPWSEPELAALTRVRREVTEFLMRIPLYLAREGPLAWRRHLLAEPSFFMATYGSLHLTSGEHAAAFVGEIAPQIASMTLEWREIRVEPLTDELAAVSAGYAEHARFVAGGEERFAGWFTGVAVRTAEGWRLQHAHWSDPIEKAGHADSARSRDASAIPVARDAVQNAIDTGQ